MVEIDVVVDTGPKRFFRLDFRPVLFNCNSDLNIYELSAFKVSIYGELSGDRLLDFKSNYTKKDKMHLCFARKAK